MGHGRAVPAPRHASVQGGAEARCRRESHRPVGNAGGIRGTRGAMNMRGRMNTPPTQGGIMATTFEDLVNNMVNVSLGAAALAADKGKELFDDLNARGAAARSEAADSDFGRSMADVFKQAGGAFGDITDRLGERGATVAERILDELIVARVRPLSTTERAAFVAHVSELVDSVDDAAVKVPVESVESEDDAADTEADTKDESSPEA